MANYQMIGARSCGLLLLGVLSAATVEGSVVGYWRFEDGASLGADSGPNNIALTPAGTPAIASISSAFHNPVPKTGAPNLLAADFESANNNLLSVADNDAYFSFQDFTIEAYIRLESTSSGTTPRTIAGQLKTGTGISQAWQIAIGGDGGGSSTGVRKLFVHLANTATGSLTLFGSAGDALPALVVDKDYYVAATVDFSASGVSVTRYIQNLTDDGQLLSLTNTSTITLLANSSAPFAIGNSYNGTSGTRPFDGIIDEVRLSNTSLAQDQLLAVPEPATAMALVYGGTLLALRRKRN